MSCRRIFFKKKNRQCVKIAADYPQKDFFGSTAHPSGGGGGLSSENLHTALNASLKSGVLELDELDFQGKKKKMLMDHSPELKRTNSTPYLLS